MAGKKKSAKNRAVGSQGTLENVTDYRHDEATRKNNPPAKIAAEGTVPIMPKIRYEYSPRLAPTLRFDSTGQADKLPELLQKAQRQTLTPAEATQLAEALRNQEPWLEWAGKREKRWFDVDPVALHIHERVSPQAILRVAARQDIEPSLFGDPQQAYHEAVQFYRHEIPWTNRLILGDSLQVMTSLSRREDLAGKVQMVFMDPPYGIRFGSNFQSVIGNREVKDKETDLTREPEMVKAYRDTWNLGIHSYLSYLRDRLLVSKELLADTGSIFVQIGDENIHRIRSLMDEVFGAGNCISIIQFKKTGGFESDRIAQICDYLLWYAKDTDKIRLNPLFDNKLLGEGSGDRYSSVLMEDGSVLPISRFLDEEGVAALPAGGRAFLGAPVTSDGAATNPVPFDFQGKSIPPKANQHWKTTIPGLHRLAKAERLFATREFINYRMFIDDYAAVPISNMWTDTMGTADRDNAYVVHTPTKVLSRCILMATNPGDLVLDPTCGGGTTATISEQWGRRWITVDTSRVAIALTRQRLLTAKFDMFQMRTVTAADSARSQNGAWLRDSSKQIEGPCTFKCETLPHVKLGGIAKNENLDPIFIKHQLLLDELLASCNEALKQVTGAVRSKLQASLVHKQKTEGRKSITNADLRRWELPESGKGWEHWQVPFDTDADWPKSLADAVTAYRKAWRTKMDEVNACIAANAEQEELIDKPEVVKGVVRVSGPFTVEAVQPPEMSLGDAKVITVGEFDGAPDEMETFEMRMVETLADQEAQNVDAYLDQMMRYLKMDGVLFPNNKVMKFHRLEPVMDGSVIHAEGRWANGEADNDPEGRANVGVVFGPQYGPITAMQVEEAIRQASRRGYDHLVLAGFSFDGTAQAVIAEGSYPKLKVHAAHIRPDVNPGMAGLLKEQPGSQLFSVFGQPRTKLDGPNADGEYTVTMEGVDIYNPVDNTVTPTKADKVAAWFIDGDYDGRTFCITQAFFPDKSAWEKLSKALDGVVDAERFEALSGTNSLPFPLGKHKCVAVEVIDPRGNEVMRIHKLEDHRG
jgi:adenine-specific DNA-methyltransferase